MCYNTEEWCKIWGETGLYSEKWYEEFGKFWPNTWKSQNLYFNPLHTTDIFWYPLETLENQRFSDVFRGYQKISVTWNGLIYFFRPNYILFQLKH